MCQTEGIGTLRSHLTGPAFEDDGGISSDDDDNDSDDEDEDEDPVPQLSRLYIPPPTIHINDKSPGPDQAKTPGTARPSPAVESTTPVTPTTSRSKLPKLFVRRPPLSTRPSYEGAPTPTPQALDVTIPSISIPPPPATATGSVLPVPPPSPILPHLGHRRSASAGSIPTMNTTTKKRFKRSWAMGKSAEYNFLAANDIVGIVMLEIQGATDLPKLKNSE